MSLQPELGHLYHDLNIQNACTNLDVQDKLRTREINARESKYLDKYLHVIDRAKKISKRRNEHDQRFLREELKGLKLRTPSLKTSLKSDRVKYKSISSSATTVKLPSLKSFDMNDITDDRKTSSDDGSMFKDLVSSRSMFSVGNRARHSSAPECSRSSVESREKRFRHITESTKSAKTPSYVRRSEQITSSLLKLFYQSKERKSKESQMTVLDILGRESKEELEKALFVLRGTPVGNAIEDILQQRQMVTSHTTAPLSASSSKSTSSESDISDEMRHFESSIIPPPNAATDCSHFSSDLNNNFPKGILENDIVSSNKGNAFVTNGTGLSKLKHYPGTTDTDFGYMLKREQSSMSSLIVNPSNTSQSTLKGVQMKWTELFKAPELWKQGQNVKPVKTAPKTLSLVTITGKRRQTMLKR